MAAAELCRKSPRAQLCAPRPTVELAVASCVLAAHVPFHGCGHDGWSAGLQRSRLGGVHLPGRMLVEACGERGRMGIPKRC